MPTFDLSTKQKMETPLGIYKGFTFHFLVPLLVQNDAYHDEEMVESSKEINHADLKDSRPQAIKSISGGATNAGGSSLPLKRKYCVEHQRRHR